MDTRKCLRTEGGTRAEMISVERDGTGKDRKIRKGKGKNPGEVYMTAWHGAREGRGWMTVNEEAQTPWPSFLPAMRSANSFQRTLNRRPWRPFVLRGDQQEGVSAK